MSRIGSTGVVVGAGVAGLSAARALAGRFDRVVVLDRDALPPEAVPRKGVPQGEHGHVLLIAGQRALEHLFPGVSDALVSAGAIEVDGTLDLLFYRYGTVWPRFPGGFPMVSASRPLLELTLRRLLLAVPGVEVLDGTAVSGLLGADGRITGVRLDDGTGIEADLVVDCSGRGGRSNRWLGALGFPAPQRVEVGVGVGYASRLYRRSPGDLDEGRAVLVMPSPPDEFRIGGALPIEGDRWIVSLGGWHDAYPRDLAGYERHARELPVPAVRKIVENCEPLSDLTVYGFPASRRRLFEKLPGPPLGYLAVGDAICSFNPIYGQGMTCAAMQADALGSLLDKHSGVTRELAGEYWRRAAAIVATPWQFATGGDFAYPQTTGPRPRGIRVLNAYSRRLQLASTVDNDMRRIFTSVQHLIQDPAVLRKPSTVWRVLKASRRAQRRLA